MNRAIERSGADVHAANRLRRPDDGREVVNAATVVGVWVVIPIALAALALLIVGVAFLTLPVGDDGEQPWTWLRVSVTVLGLAVYWGALAVRSGRSALWGLWVLIPIVSLVPTFVIARDVAAGKEPTPTEALEDDEGRMQSPAPDSRDRVDL